ncbi:hypothetical protein AVEN_198972-1, partial [Araneus ventricosus]
FFFLAISKRPQRHSDKISVSGPEDQARKPILQKILRAYCPPALSVMWKLGGVPARCRPCLLTTVQRPARPSQEPSRFFRTGR